MFQRIILIGPRNIFNVENFDLVIYFIRLNLSRRDIEKNKKPVLDFSKFSPLDRGLIIFFFFGPSVFFSSGTSKSRQSLWKFYFTQNACINKDETCFIDHKANIIINY